MTHEGFVLRSLRHRRLATVLSALAVALGVGLVVAVDGLRRAARARFERAAVSWDLVVGPKGSPLQIVLYTVFQMDEAPGTLPESVWHRLRDDPRVERALPWTVGDTFRGFRIVGTSGEVFGFEARPGAAVRCAAGRPFAEFDPGRPAWEAVLGATVAAAAGLRPGDTFVATHGLAESPAAEEHDEAPWTVVGVLEATDSPMDRVVLIPHEAFYAMEGHDPAAGHADGGGDGDGEEERRLSAVIVKARNPFFALQLHGELRASPDAQPARPFEQVGRLFDIVGRWDRLLLAVAGLVVAVAALGILVSMTNAMNERRRDIALMRALGARRRVVGGLIVGEAAAVGALGAAGGILLGHGLIALGAARIAEWSGVRIPALAFSPEEIVVFAGAVALCALAGLVPAARAYRVDVATGLGGEA